MVAIIASTYDQSALAAVEADIGRTRRTKRNERDSTSTRHRYDVGYGRTAIGWRRQFMTENSRSVEGTKRRIPLKGRLIQNAQPHPDNSALLNSLQAPTL